MELNLPDEARAAASEAQAHHLDTPVLHLNLYLVDFLQHDTAGMEREADGLITDPGWKDFMLSVESGTAAYGGQMMKSRELTKRAVDSALHADRREAAASYQASAAVSEALYGNLSLARQQAKAALALSRGGSIEPLCGLALALAGNSAQATQLAETVANRWPKHTEIQFDYLPAIHAANALETGNPAKAIEVLTPSASYELGDLEYIPLYGVYLRGMAFLAQRQGAAAVAEFQKILDHPGVVGKAPIGALAHLGIGRAYTLSGDSVKAKMAYQDFFALWQDADSDIPIFRQARMEYAKLL